MEYSCLRVNDLQWLVLHFGVDLKWSVREVLLHERM